MTAELGVKLEIDESAAHALEKIKGGFEKVGEKVSEVQHELAGMLKQTIAVAAGFQLSGAIDSMKELVHETFGAASASEKQIKNLAGVLALTDKSGMSFAETAEKAEGLKEELEAIGVKAGASSDSVIEAFSMIAERSGKSKEAVLELTSQMAEAAKILPGGIDQMAGAFRDLESGILRPRNALVQMMKQTGVVGGTAKQIAKGLNSMIQGGQMEKVTKLAEDAIARMAKKASAAPATFDQLVASLRNIREQLFVAFGAPMVKAVAPQLEMLKKYLIDNKEKFGEMAKHMGEKVGEWVKQAADKIREGFQYIQNHADQIQKAIEDGFKMAKQVVEFILAHKEEIAIAFGAKALGPSVLGGVKTGVGLAKGAMSVGGMIAAKSGLEGVGALGGAGFAAAGVAALSGAIVGLGATAWQATKLWQETAADRMSTEEINLNTMQGMVDQHRRLNEQEMNDFKNLKQRAIEAAGGIESKGGRQVAQRAGSMELTMAQRNLAETMIQSSISGRMRRAGIGEGGKEIGDVDTDKMGVAAEGIIENYNKALKTNDVATMTYIAGFVKGNDRLKNAIMNKASEIEGGFNAMADRFGVGQATTPGWVGMMVDQFKKGTASPPIMNFSGNINIQQDFRDQDPDRVAVVLRKDLGNAASRSVSAKIPGGGLGF